MEPHNREVIELYMAVTSEKFTEVSRRLERIELKMEQLISFRWMMIGMSTALSAVISIAIALIER